MVAALRSRQIFAGLSIMMGLALLVGGARRISATAYVVVSQTGGTWLWGPTFLTIGLIIAFVPRPYLRWALLLGGAMYAILCTAFILAAIESPIANLTAPVAYGWITLVHAVVSERLREESQWTPRRLSRSAAG